MKNNAFFLEGDDRLVILIHAYTSSSVDVDSLGRAVNREGYSVYAPVLSGHNEDQDMDDLLEYNAEDWVKDGQKIVQDMRDKGFDKITIFGLSLGGIVAMKTFMDDEDIIAAGSFSSSLYDNGKNSNVDQNFEQYYKKSMPESKLTEDNLQIMREKLKENEKVMQHLVNDIMTPEYDQITRPVFVGQGGQDTMIDSEIAKNYKDQLVNADVSFHWYEDAPHVITVGRHGKALQSDFIPFLNNLNWNRGNND